ncbi:MAG TPA: sigma-70 family RNA polymerase sigma factor, partial [Sunxiuqinia sp.]|nr:sigma-70 family RNA polymerase sigma factor [Sunxiuqinia sp.]
EVFTKIWEDKRKIKIQGSVKSYLYTAVRNRSLNKLKSETTREGHTKSYSQHTDQVVDLVEIEQEEFRLFLLQCIEKLPPRCQDVFARSRFDGMKQDQIASEMDIAIKTVKAQIGKALKLLRECLSVSHPHFF